MHDRAALISSACVLCASPDDASSRLRECRGCDDASSAGDDAGAVGAEDARLTEGSLRIDVDGSATPRALDEQLAVVGPGSSTSYSVDLGPPSRGCGRFRAESSHAQWTSAGWV
jgi:hypothetical protein